MTRSLFYFICGAFTVQVLVACQSGDGPRPLLKKGASSPSSPTTTPAPGSNAAGGSSPNGTIDGAGGGNGVDGKIYESYARDPRKLPAYLEKLKPIFDHYDDGSRAQDPAGAKRTATTLDSFFDTKVWYFVPSSLEAISKDALGVSMLREKTQQIAIQKDRAIWIDTRIFDSMDKDQQATVIMHEFLMSIYFLKFKTLREICDTQQRNRPDLPACDIPKDSEPVVDRLYAPSALRPLNTEDYENIRTATIRLMSDGAKAPLREIKSILVNNGFDRRFFSPDAPVASGSSPQKPTLSTKELVSMLERARLAGRLPETCVSREGRKLTACRLRWSKGRKNLEVKVHLGTAAEDQIVSKEIDDWWSVDVLDANDRVVAQSDFGREDGQYHPVTVSHPNTGESETFFASIPMVSSTKPVGTKLSVIVFFVRKIEHPEPSYEIDHIGVRSLVIVQRDGDKCRVETPANIPADEKVFYLRSDALPAPKSPSIGDIMFEETQWGSICL